MERWIRTFLIVGFVLFAGAPGALAEKRVALVIGNSSYEKAAPLANPKNDANALAAVLSDLQFEVVKGIDLDRSEFEGVVRKFVRAIRGADVALLFYAGHGLQVKGRNYLAPIDADLSDEADLDFETLPLRTILKHMERHTRTNLVFLDACRDNPLARNLARSMGTRSVAVGRGLARVETGVGTLIAFATEPGNVALDGWGGNSPFTTALLKHIETPGLDVDLMLRRVRKDVLELTSGKQVPWSNSSLTGRFEFAAVQAGDVPGQDKPAKSGAPTVATGSDRTIELAYWDAIVGSKAAADFESYLRKFPSGAFAELARLRIKRLKQAALTEREPVKKPVPAARGQRIELTSGVKKDEKSGKARLGVSIMSVPERLAPCFAFEGKRGVLVSNVMPGSAAEQTGIRKGEIILSWDGKETSEPKALVEAVVATDTDARVKVSLWRAPSFKTGFDQHLIRCARKTGAGAMIDLAGLFEFGNVVDKDAGRAEDLKNEAGTKDPKEAADVMNQRGYTANQRKDYKEAVRWYRKAAELGHAHAMGNLARKYYRGIGVPKDHREAFRWYRKSAEKDVLDSVASLGWLYYQGQGVPRDYAEALKWTRKAAEKDNPHALANLGLHYYYGHGVGRDYREAMKWYRKSADKGHGRAMHFIAGLYASGKGVTKNLRTAADWYEKATAKGYLTSAISLGNMYVNGEGVQTNYLRGFELYKKAEGHDPVVWNNLAYLYATGLGTRKDAKKAAELVVKALESGNDFTVKQMSENAGAWGRPFRLELQKLLRDRGFYKGAIDGAFGSGTVSAIRQAAGK